jgi:hypothetical protein
VKSLSESEAVGDTTPDKGTPSTKPLAKGKAAKKAARKALDTLLMLPAMGLAKR